MNKEVKRVFTPKPLIPLQNAGKLGSFVARAKLYSAEKTVGSCKYGEKRREVYINVNKTSTYTSTVARETYITNHRFNCNEGCLVYYLTCNKYKMLGRLLPSSGLDGTITKVTLESKVR